MKKEKSKKVTNPDGSKADYKVKPLKVKTVADKAKEEMIKKAATEKSKPKSKDKK